MDSGSHVVRLDEMGIKSYTWEKFIIEIGNMVLVAPKEVSTIGLQEEGNRK